MKKFVCYSLKDHVESTRIHCTLPRTPTWQTNAIHMATQYVTAHRWDKRFYTFIPTFPYYTIQDTIFIVLRQKQKKTLPTVQIVFQFSFFLKVILKFKTFVGRLYVCFKMYD